MIGLEVEDSLTLNNGESNSSVNKFEFIYLLFLSVLDEWYLSAVCCLDEK